MGDVPVPLGWSVSPTPPACPRELADAHTGQNCCNCHAEGQASSAMSQLAGAEQDVQGRGSATTQKRGIRGSLPSQSPAEASQRLVGTRTQVLHKGVQKSPKGRFVSCRINVTRPASALVLLAEFAEADLGAWSMNQGVPALLYSPARGIGADCWFQTRQTSGQNWDCPPWMVPPFLCADICSHT